MRTNRVPVRVDHDIRGSMQTLREIAEETHELEMTPLIDVTFLLLIFFLLTLKFRVLEGKLSAYLPKDAGQAPQAAELPEAVEIRLEVVDGAEGQRVFAAGEDRGEAWRPEAGRRFTMKPGTRSLSYLVGPRRYEDLASVRERLGQLHAADPERPARIDPGRATFIGDVVAVVDALREAGFQSITFVGEARD